MTKEEQAALEARRTAMGRTEEVLEAMKEEVCVLLLCVAACP